MSSIRGDRGAFGTDQRSKRHLSSEAGDDADDAASDISSSKSRAAKRTKSSAKKELLSANDELKADLQQISEAGQRRGKLLEEMQVASARAHTENQEAAQRRHEEQQQASTARHQENMTAQASQHADVMKETREANEIGKRNATSLEALVGFLTRQG